MQTTIVQRRCKILTKKQRNKSQNKGKNAENRAAPTARKTRAQHTVQKAGRGPGRMKNLPGEKNKRKMAKKRAERKRHGQREEKGRRIGWTYTDAREGGGCCTARRLFYKRFDREGKFRGKRGGRRQCGTFDKERLRESPKGNGRVAGMGYHGRKSKAAVFRRKGDGANGGQIPFGAKDL